MHVQLNTSSSVPKLVQISAQWPQNHYEKTKTVFDRTFSLQTPKNFQYQRKTNNRTIKKIDSLALNNQFMGILTLCPKGIDKTRNKPTF